MGRKKHQLVLVTNPQALEELPEVLAQSPVPFQETWTMSVFRTKTGGEENWPRTFLVSPNHCSICHLFLPLSTLWAEGKPHISTEPPNSATLAPKQHWKCPNLPSVGPGVQWHKCRPFPGEWWGRFFTFSSPRPAVPSVGCFTLTPAAPSLLHLSCLSFQRERWNPFHFTAVWAQVLELIYLLYSCAVGFSLLPHSHLPGFSAPGCDWCLNCIFHAFRYG